MLITKIKIISRNFKELQENMFNMFNIKHKVLDLMLNDILNNMFFGIKSIYKAIVKQYFNIFVQLLVLNNQPIIENKRFSNKQITLFLLLFNFSIVDHSFYVHI